MADVDGPPPKSAGGNAGGNHMATVRSLGLMNDLQEYIVTVEAIAAKRKSEIDRLKEEKREMEKLLTMRKADKRNTGGSNTPTKFGPKSGFGDIANLDISPKVRAIVEDNRMLREELKVSRDKIRTHEKTLAAQQLTINKLKGDVDSVTQQLAACSRQPDDVIAEEEMKATLTLREGSVKDLESRVSILTHKVETDAKRARDDMRTKDKAVAALQQKLEEKTAALDAKDKELRAKVLESKAITKKLDNTRRNLGTMRQENSFLQEQLEELHQEEFGETTMQKREQTQASKVHVMLCVINGQSEVAQQETSSTDNDPVEEASHALEPDDAAVKVQSVYRGHLVRRNMEEKKKADEEQAAIKIQAQTRGHLARKEMESMHSGVDPGEAEAQAEAATKIQAGFRGHQARKHIADKRLEAQAAEQGGDAAKVESTSVSTKSSNASDTKKKADVPRGKGANAARAARPTNAANNSKVGKK